MTAFLQRCTRGLNPDGGLIVIKDNVSEQEDVFDEEDSSVTRCMPTLLAVIKKAGLEIIKEEEQTNFPSSFYPVKMSVHILIPIVF